MNRIAAACARAALACAGLALGMETGAQPAPASTVASQAALPRPPHQVTPDAPVYPDYYALALSHTSLTDDPAWRPLHLRVAGRKDEPAVIVLPVQTQAYGFSPTFRALLGARLDQELQRRHVDASRQTDIVDWRGPFVRRTDDATLAAFAAEHAGATLMMLYLGHDGAGHAFVSLARIDAGNTRIARRRVDIPQDLVPTLDAFTALLPPLLAELGLGDAKPAPAPGASGAAGCEMADWNLEDVPPAATPRTMACHALLMGTLMPEFMARVAELSQPSSPDRLAWLARAWVEATALAPRSPAMQSAAALASLQLRIEAKQETTAGPIDDRDVVVRPLARMLWARKRAESMPKSSSDAAVDEYVESAVAGLPDFAKSIVEEHTQFAAQFHRVDMCAMELQVPHFRLPPGCDDDAPAGQPRTRPASLSESQLLETWRLAAAWSDLHVEGKMRGSASGVASVLHALPTRIATHPFIREMHFAVRGAETPAREAAAHLAATRASILDYAQVIATLQRGDAVLMHHDVDETPMLPAETVDPAILQVEDDLRRLSFVDHLDFHGMLLWRPGVDPAMPAAFLTDGRFADALRSVTKPAGANASFAQAPAPAGPFPGHGPAASSAPPRDPVPPSPAITQYTFVTSAPWALPDKASLEKTLAAKPSDIEARIALALIALEHGAGVAEARRIIDARPRRTRAEDAIGEAENWADAAHAFWFAGELDLAREYYARAAATGVGSESDLQSQARIAAIDGDLHAALAQTQRRVARYDNDWAVSDEAGYLFMLSRTEEAWALILPRAQTSTSPALWRAALAGHRIAGDALAVLPDWIRNNGLNDVVVDRVPIAPFWLQEYATLDRIPDASARATVASINPNALWTGGTATLKAAIAGTPASPNELNQDVQSFGMVNIRLLPFFAWVTWNSTQGRDPMLQHVREVSPDGGFPGVLAKAMVLAADGRRDEASSFLRIARYELGRRGTTWRLPDASMNAPYDFVLATWLMTRQTGERAYAEQGLAIARAYQRVTASMGWPYAAEALLSRDPKAREVAACRARKLDPASMFLHESDLRPDPDSAVCRKATAW